MSAIRETQDQDTIVVSDSDFEKFRDFFYRKTGIKFEDTKRYFVDKRLIDRITKTGHQNFRSYFTFVRFQASGDEMQKLINCMTVNETYFYREEYQFQCMVENVLGLIVKQKKHGEDIRIWSVPSSTGEEPYSIALYLLEKWDGIDDIDVEIISSDIDSGVLEKCRKGIYGQRSLQHLPSKTKRKYFHELAGGFHEISSDVKNSINFSKLNLNDPTAVKKYRNVDLIFCRNLLIYFDDESRRNAVEAFYDALNPGGFIFLGHSESMSRISSLFEVHKFAKSLVYRKPLK